MNVLDNKTINEIIKRILSVSQPERIIIFGSAATNQMTKDSDIDILVVKQSITNHRLEALEMDKAFMGLGYPCDVLIITSKRFEETKNIIGTIAYPSNKYGKVIYDKAA